jgi:hypothetical protein
LALLIEVVRFAIPGSREDIAEYDVFSTVAMTRAAAMMETPMALA